MQVLRINPSNKWNRGNKVKSQRMIKTLLNAKKENPDITIQELNYIAHGWKQSQYG